MQNTIIKVKCIDNRGFKKDLSIGKIYDVKQASIHKDYYEILLGNNTSILFRKKHFEVINN